MKPLKIFESHLDEEINNRTDTNPTQKQIEDDSYDKAPIVVQGLAIKIENPKNSTRSGVDEYGNAWESTMKSHYGELIGTEGKDEDCIDVFVGENLNSDIIFVIDQVNPKTKVFDESKVMLGYDSEEQAKQAYLENYEDNWQGLGNITPVKAENFKIWLYDGIKQVLPFHKYPKI